MSWEARVEWQDLRARYGELSPFEEALICRVTACTTVLRLPSELQLGYRGNVINFTNSLATIAKQLPLAPKDCGVIVYRVPHKGKDGRATSRLERVRKEAIREHLRFLSRHHAVYRDGIRNPRGLFCNMHSNST